MNKNWKNERRKYVDIELTPEGPKYIGIAFGQRVEVSKEVYLVLEHGIHKEFKMDCERFDGNHVSLDELIEEIDDYDRCGSVPCTLQSRSAEGEYFDACPVDEYSIPDKIAPELSQLSRREKELLFTYGKRDPSVKQVAKRENVSKRTIERYRKKAAEKVKTAYERRVESDE